MILDMHAAAAAKSLQLCPTLCDPIDGSPPGSMGFSRQEYWSGVPLPYPYICIDIVKKESKVESLSRV